MNLSPRDFWSLTPAEWNWLLHGEAGEGLSLAELEELIARYPEEKEKVVNSNVVNTGFDLTRSSSQR